MAQRVKSLGIFHGLPDYDGIGKKHSALIAGANGITGSHVVKVLNENPDIWSNVYALSRKEPANPLGGNVKYLTMDLLNSPSAIASQLKDVGPM
jgi:nucleoside-diphosphate-sugar epimerase